MTEEYERGKLLLIDKPYTWTSFDVVNSIRLELRRKKNISKVKIGHAGTLDPLATGLILVCTGSFTKKISLFQDMQKEYIGQMFLGATTPSFDMETEQDAVFPVDHITPELLYETTKYFIGTIEQLPPLFSAVKIKGKRAYDYARQGQNIEIQPKSVTISAFDITHFEENIVTFRIQCSKGTYIRALARDFGAKLGSGAYLRQLRRTSIGEYLVVNAISPSEFSLSLEEE